MDNSKNKYLFMLIWFASGYVCWLTVLLCFTYITYPIIEPISYYFAHTFQSKPISYFVDFILFYSTDFFWIAIFSLGLSFLTNANISSLLSFVIGYIPIRRLIEMFQDNYGSIPSWTFEKLSQAFIAYLIMIPFIAWITVTIVKKERQKAAESKA